MPIHNAGIAISVSGTILLTIGERWFSFDLIILTLMPYKRAAKMTLEQGKM